MKYLLSLFLCLGIKAAAQVSIPQFDNLGKDTMIPVPIHISPKGYMVGYTYYEYCTNVICFNDGMRVSVFDKNGTLATSISFEKPANNTSVSSRLFVHDAVFDNNNDLILAGTFHSEINFDPNNTTATLLAGNTEFSNTTDIFLAKYSIPDGKLKWVKVMSGSNNPLLFFSHLTVDKNNNIYLLGSKLSGTFDLNPGPANVPVTSPFIARYSATGDYLTSKPVGDISTQYYRSLRYTNNQLILLTNEDSSGKKTFSMKQYDPNTLNVIKAKKFGMFNEDNISTGRRKAYDFVFGKNEIWMLGEHTNYLYMYTATGTISQSLAANERAFFIARLDTSWNIQEAKMLHKTKNPYYCPVKLGVDSLNNLMVIGSVMDSLDADLGNGTYWVKPTAGANKSCGYMLYYDNNLSLQWAKTFGEATASNVSLAAFDAGKNIYVSGTFKGTANFSMTGTPANHTSLLANANLYHARYVWNTAKQPTGILNRPSAELLATIYPNPAADALYISLKGQATNVKELTCTVYDTKGSMVRTETTGTGSNVQISLTSLPPAQYYLHITDGKAINETHRFLKR